MDVLKDTSFLKELDLMNIKTKYVKIIVLDFNENPIEEIQGRVSGGSLSIAGSSSVRRSGNIEFIAELTDNDLTNINHLLSINKKIKVEIGLKNNINKSYDDIIWFNQGIFIIEQPVLNHNKDSISISLQLKDKMSLLNGECGGTLPTSITFHEYIQEIGEEVINYTGGIESALPADPNNYTIYCFKKTGENPIYMSWNSDEGWKKDSPNNIGTQIINTNSIFDIIQTLVCNYGHEDISNIIITEIPLEFKSLVRYVGNTDLYYDPSTGSYLIRQQDNDDYLKYSYNEDCGYIYTPFVYPGELISSIGDTICSVLDKIVETLGNYEYFYDIEGKFIFQEKKNYINTQYNPIQTLDRTWNIVNRDGSGEAYLVSNTEYSLNLSNLNKSVYTFENNNTLINSYSNTPNFLDIKNDYHIWGKDTDGYAIHYHLVIKDKPEINTYYIRVRENNGFEIAEAGEEGAIQYIPDDWRVELFMRGLRKKKYQQRPDIYEQEILDNLQSIYDIVNKEWLVNIKNPNELNYWIDYIMPNDLLDISVDLIGSRIYTEQQDNICRLYNIDVPETILINLNENEIVKQRIIDTCNKNGQSFSQVSEEIYKNLAIGTSGYAAEEYARTALMNHTQYGSSISLSTVPIYYLDVNTLITVNDIASGIYGDYLIDSINVPLDINSVMSINANKIKNRV